jgi:hypothetical protein
MKKPLGIMTVLMGLMMLLLGLQDVHGYRRYNDGCQTCHGSFLSNSSEKPNNTWPDSKHDVHRQQMLDNVCDACHLDGDGNNPYLNQSNGTPNLPGIGCNGCHARYYPQLDTYIAAGLRQHHEDSGVTICAVCHGDDPPAWAERYPAAYYGKPTVNITGPCNTDGSENWTPDGLGLDNDGDLAYDTDDSNCQGPPRWQRRGRR